MFYRPQESVAADVIPFYRDGEFYLFYLRDYRNVAQRGEGTPWFLLKTRDFVSFEEMGEVISRGNSQAQDLYVFTGSVIQKGDCNYIFYTGHNPHYIAAGKHQEAVMMARSTDMRHWKKQEDFLLEVPDFMEEHDFRDPFVFQDEKSGKYYMLLAARHREGNRERRGYTAYAVSDDLWHWEVKEEPFYDPELYFTHECPDLFRMGEWWYLIFSEFTDKCVTHYRMAKDFMGPWITPEQDTFDNRNFYAAKTVSDGENRYVIGWNPTNEKNQDFELTQWGGNIVVHQLIQQPDGRLCVCVPESVGRQYSRSCTYSQAACSGRSEKTERGWNIGRWDGSSSILFEGMRDNCKISFDIIAKKGTKRVSLLLNCDEGMESGYYEIFDLEMQRIGFDRRPKRRNDFPFMLETERRIEWKEERPYRVECLIDGPVAELYFDGKVALSARMNELRGRYFGFLCEYGEIRIDNLKVETVSGQREDAGDVL